MSKYNSKKVIENGIKFDSQAESLYYLDLVERYARGEILGVTLQPKYELQPKYINADGKKVQAINYVADFEIVHLDNTLEVVDIKGQILPMFTMKRKMFEFKYEKIISIIKYTKTYGFEYLDEYEARVKEKKRNRKKVTMV